MYLAQAQLCCFGFHFFTQRRVAVPKEKYSIKDILPIIFKNDSLLVLSAAMLLNTNVWVTGNAVANSISSIFLCGNLQSTFFMVMLPANLLGALVTPQLTKRYGKRTVFMYASIAVAVFSFGDILFLIVIYL